MNIKERIIRRLGGIPLPPGNAKLHLLDSNGFIVISGYSEDLIAFMGGVPLPKPGCTLLVRKDGDIFQTADDAELLEAMHAVAIPEPGQGQHAVRPFVRRAGHRKINIVVDGEDAEIIAMSGGEQKNTQPEPALMRALQSLGSETVINLCDHCGATPAEHDQAIRQFDNHQNTIECDRWRPE
jgi:hypothetical protein